MRCFLCNTTLKEQLYAEHSILLCPCCHKYYIEAKYINSIIRILSKSFKFKNNNHLNIFLNKVLLYKKDSQYKIQQLVQTCQNKFCRVNCDLILFEYNKFEFIFCNFSDYYIIDKMKLKEFLQKQYKKTLIEYYIEIIFTKIKRLFIKG